MIDLQQANRDELIRLVIAQHERILALETVVAEQRATIATLEATVGQLTQRVGELLAAQEAAGDDTAGPGSPAGMPGLKPATGKARPPKAPRKRREQAFVRHRMVPTQQVIHALDTCPRCGMPLTGGSVKRTREVIEVPVVPAVVTEHVYLERCCPHCRTRHTPRVALGQEVVGKQRFGVGLIGQIATLREEARLPMATIQCGRPLGSMATFHHLSVSVGAIAGAIQQVARAATGMMTGIREAIRGSPVAHMDETGWREDGGQWLCVGLRHAGGGLLRAWGSLGGDGGAAFGEEFAGTLVSDFSVGYAPYVGVKQKCWAGRPLGSMLRAVHDLRLAHPKDARVAAWAAGVHDVYEQATTWKQAHPHADDRTRQAARERFAAALTAVYAPYVESTTPQRVLSARMAKHLHELFVFVVEPAVPPDNNRAERDLRGRPMGSMVTSRKISGGTRSEAGSAAKMTSASVFGTWRKRGENPDTACRALLLSPQL